MTSFVGEQVNDLQAIVIRKAIQMWVNHGMRANRAYTPGNLAATAGRITGLKYTSSKKSLAKAVTDIEAMYPGVFK